MARSQPDQKFCTASTHPGTDSLPRPLIFLRWDLGVSMFLRTKHPFQTSSLVHIYFPRLEVYLFTHITINQPPHIAYDKSFKPSLVTFSPLSCCSLSFNDLSDLVRLFQQRLQISVYPISSVRLYIWPRIWCSLY